MVVVTDIVDQAVILPLVAMIALMLALQGWRRGAIAWLAATAGTFGLVLILKLILIGCGDAMQISWLRSPSGHTASAALISGGLVARFIFSAPLTLMVATVAAIVMGYTRVALDFHSFWETVTGGVIGIAGAVALARLAGPPPPARIRPLIVVVALVILAFHGRRLPAEMTIQQTSPLIRVLLPWCEPSAMTPIRPS